MRTLHKLLTGTVLVALTTFGLTALTSSSTDSDDTPVWGFTDKECRSQDYKLFENLGALIAADGKKDPDATGEDADKIWNWRSYIEDGDWSYTCHVVKYEEVVSVGVVPKRSIIPAPAPGTYGGGGGGSGGGGTPVPKASDIADKKTDSDIEALKSCWEEKAKNKFNKNGWDPNAKTAATWTIDRSQGGGNAQTFPNINKNKELELAVELYPLGIANKAVYFSKIDEDEDYYRGFEEDIFDHLTTYGQMHETYHIGQFLKIFNKRGTLPEPWEYWQMEVDAHTESKNLWTALYDDPPPSFLPKEEKAMSKEYTDNTVRYKALKKKEEEGTLIYKVDKDGKVITDEAKELEDLGKWLKNPANLPQAQDNMGRYKPSEVENFECKEEKKK